ncbi:MAG: endo-1,4-beta-xylanase [Deltaproteobacteria bacterium]|nr:endo-1,4-beta-xylanase [Deltaproteobacteria bacterium]
MDISGIRVNIVWLVWASLQCLSGCFAVDLEPLDGPVEQGAPGIADSDDKTIQSDDALVVRDSDTPSTVDSGMDSDTDTLLHGTETGSGTAVDSSVCTESCAPEDTDTGMEKGTEADVEDTDSGPVGKWVGCSVKEADFDSNFFTLWNQVSPENAGLWGNVEMEQDVMTWDTLDKVYSEASAHNVTVIAHTLLWIKEQPTWLAELTPEEQVDEVYEWIGEFCTRYPDVNRIVVAKAPFHDPPAVSAALGGAGVTGYDWLINVYTEARKLCPGKKLLVDEYNALTWDTTNYMGWIIPLVEEGLIDGIGCAGHDLTGLSREQLERNIGFFTPFKLPIYITAFNLRYADDNEQLKAMQRLFPALYENPAIRGITFWGYLEGNMWSTGTLDFADAYLQRENGTPRPALEWLMTYLGRGE